MASFYFNPLYWPLWLAFGVLRLLVWLPYKMQMRLGRFLGKILYCFNAKSKRAAKVNLEKCFPEKTDKEREALLKKNYASVGMFVFEIMLSFWGSERKLKKLDFDIDEASWQIYHTLKAKGTGILFAGPHFTSLEICGRLFSMREPFVAMYRKSKLPFLENLLRPSLDKHYAAVVERKSLRQLMRVLSENLTVWYAADVDAGVRNSVFAPFFGVETATLTAPAKIAAKTGASVIVVAFYRKEEGTGYRCEGLPMPSDYPTGDPLKDATLLNERLEAAIRKAPDQFLWQYKRFKTRPNNEPRFYE